MFEGAQEDGNPWFRQGCRDGRSRQDAAIVARRRAIGEIAVIGVLTTGHDIDPVMLISKGSSMRGIMVGSRAMALDLNRVIEVADIRPVIDRSLFEDALAALRYQSSGDLFGKVVIAI